MRKSVLGAGVIPVALQGGEVLFLFQRVFSGRKSGYLIDFGGGLADGESYHETAIREFIEETETMYFSDNLKRAKRTTERVKAQIHVVGNLFEQTMIAYPDWWCKRMTVNPLRPKDWRTYFIVFPYRDISLLNREWQMDSTNRFKKRRELVWVPADELLKLCARKPGKLWKRVRQLEHLGRHVRSISLTLRRDARLIIH
ncbi:NUDIX domain-containing protein [Gammaproteobacteria bacterium]|nr:NUDIX domain-containing protein [Gammaproteobacteria bacterium]